MKTIKDFTKKLKELVSEYEKSTGKELNLLATYASVKEEDEEEIKADAGSVLHGNGAMLTHIVCGAMNANEDIGDTLRKGMLLNAFDDIFADFDEEMIKMSKPTTSD